MSLIQNNESFFEFVKIPLFANVIKESRCSHDPILGRIRSKLQNHYEKIANLSVYYAGAFLELPAIKNKSSIAIREFIDDAKNHLRALEKLDEISWRNTMILVILMRKLDSIMLGEWRERALALKRNPTFKDFYQFLETRATYLEIYFRISN